MMAGTVGVVGTDVSCGRSLEQFPLEAQAQAVPLCNLFIRLHLSDVMTMLVCILCYQYHNISQSKSLVALMFMTSQICTLETQTLRMSGLKWTCFRVKIGRPYKGIVEWALFLVLVHIASRNEHQLILDAQPILSLTPCGFFKEKLRQWFMQPEHTKLIDFFWLQLIWEAN